jgi:hypothetical protein
MENDKLKRVHDIKFVIGKELIDKYYDDILLAIDMTRPKSSGMQEDKRTGVIYVINLKVNHVGHIVKTLRGRFEYLVFEATPEGIIVKEIESL